MREIAIYTRSARDDRRVNDRQRSLVYKLISKQKNYKGTYYLMEDYECDSKDYERPGLNRLKMFIETDQLRVIAMQDKNILGTDKIENIAFHQLCEEHEVEVLYLA